LKIRSLIKEKLEKRYLSQVKRDESRIWVRGRDFFLTLIRESFRGKDKRCKDKKESFLSHKLSEVSNRGLNLSRKI